MLSLNDFNHLKLLYEQLFNANSHIKDLVLKSDWESVGYAIQQKDSLLKQILLFEKPRLNDIKQNDELNSFRLKLIELEQKNIELIKKLKNNLIQELSGVKKTKKVLNTYEPTTNNSVSTFEINYEE